MSQSGDSPTDGWMKLWGSAGHAVSQRCSFCALNDRASHVQYGRPTIDEAERLPVKPL